MKLVDCNCHFGKTAYMDPGSFYEKEILLKKMKQFNIEKAMVYHTRARDYSPIEGNQLLLDEINENNNLLPVLVVLPNHTGEFINIENIDKKTKGIRLFPAPLRHCFSLMDYSCHEIYDFSAKRHLPIFMDLDQCSWDMVDTILSNHPDLQLIITNTGYREDRHIYPLIKKHKNLYFDTSRYFGHQAIETFVNKFGSEQILFGSGMPVYSGGGGAYFMEKLILNEQDQKNICYRNIERIIGGVSL